MKFRPISLFIALIVAAQLHFASAETSSQTNDLYVAREALRDGLWKVARTHASKVNGDEALLIVLESFASEGNWDGVKKALGARGAEGDAAPFRYYRAAIEARRKDAALILADSGESEALIAAKMIEADILNKNGDKIGAQKLWREVVASSNASERAYTIAASNIGETSFLRKAYAKAKMPYFRRLAGVKLASALVNSIETLSEGLPIVLRIAKDSPDAPGAMEAFIALAEAELSAQKWADAEKRFRDAQEIWPQAGKLSSVAEGRGWAQLKQGKMTQALESFARAEELADTDEGKAAAILKQGDILGDISRGEEAMAKYREVLAKYPKTSVAEKLKKIVAVRELESSGREHYNNYRFAEARKIFAKVSSQDPSLKPTMDFYDVLCLYGLGNDVAAERAVREIILNGKDPAVKLEAKLWLAKFLFNAGSWKESGRLFEEYADAAPDGKFAPEALMWASRAAFAATDLPLAIQTATKLASRYSADSPAKIQALLVQSEALIESARFDEAVLILERVISSNGVSGEDRLKAGVLKADALFAMGSDNASRYDFALQAYQSLRQGGTLKGENAILISFKIARTLDKLKRTEEAIEEYYTSVVLAYVKGRNKGEVYSDRARAAFTRAAFTVVDHYESGSNDFQAIKILELVAQSDVPAAKEAQKRILAIREKGNIL
jgi:TolA-binding protein